MQEVYIYGCGGVGNEIAEHLLGSNKYKVLGFIDDNYTIRECMGYPCKTLDEMMKIEKPESIKTIISVGEPLIRECLSKKIEERGIEEIIVNLSSHHSERFSKVGKGTLLHFGSYISVNTTIGRCCMINKGAIIAHDCIVGDYSVVCPSVTLGGNVYLGEKTFIGTGAVIRNGIRIGKNVIIGMGSIVTKDVEDDAVMVGNPAKFVRKNESHLVFK